MSQDEDAKGDGAQDPMNPERWYREPKVCGSCIAWRPESPPKEGDTVATGQCKLRPEIGRVPASLKMCSLYKGRGQYTYTPSRDPGPQKKRRAGEVKVLRRTEDGQMVASSVAAPKTRSAPPERPVYQAPREIDLGDGESLPVFKAAIVELMREELGRSDREMLRRYKGGKVLAKTADGKTVEFSAEKFFSVLDRFKSSLHELEEAVRSHPAAVPLRDELLPHVRRARGTFTTFNVMYADREDYFSGKD